jgi:hypothetical protein
MRRSFKRGNFSRIGGVVNHALDNLGLRHKVKEQQVVLQWAQLVGPQNAASSRAENVREGILFVTCKSSTWSSELSLHKAEILRRIAQSVGKNVVTDIRFSARGFRQRQDSAAKDAAGVETKSVEAISLTEDEIQQAKHIAAECSSAELAAKIEKAIITGKRLEKAKRSDSRHAELGSASSGEGMGPESSSG